jgi:hypothetical protein
MEVCRKYGWDFHIKEVLEIVDIGLMDEREIYWIKEFDSIVNGLNCRDGGSNGKLSAETKLRISESNMGRINTTESNIKRSLTLEIINHNPDVKSRRRDGAKKAILTRTINGNMVSALKGKKLTKEDRDKKSIAAKNREKIRCSNCGMLSDPGNIKRWHGSNCKSLKI